MKHLKTFESYNSSSMTKDEMMDHLCSCGYAKYELEDKSEEELTDMVYETPYGITEAKKKKEWIQPAIKRPGALRASLDKEEGEKITAAQIKKEEDKLKRKDKDKKKPGVQLGKKDLRKYRQLVLADTLRKF